MRPGWLGSCPSRIDVRRNGYAKLSEVVNVSVPLERESEVSGPVRVNGEDAFKWRVYGGP